MFSSTDYTQQNNWVHFIYKKKKRAKLKQKLERLWPSLQPFSRVTYREM